MRILIVEDDPSLGIFLQKGLKLEGHDMHLVVDGVMAVNRAAAERFDLIVLDLSLPRKDGIEVLEEIRELRIDTSILILTGRHAVADRVRCLDLGADDFMQKPFSFSELTARCRALLRRRERFADPVLRHDDLELHRMERKVVHAGTVVDLTVKEFALLEYLMLARGRTCTRGELLKQVWQMSPDAGTNVVDVYVNYLRKKLFCSQDGPASTRVIETVRGEGYSLCMGSVRKPMGRAVGSVAFESGRVTLPFAQGVRASA